MDVVVGEFVGIGCQGGQFDVFEVGGDVEFFQWVEWVQFVGDGYWCVFVDFVFDVYFGWL